MGLVYGEHGAKAGVRHDRRGPRRAHPLPCAPHAHPCPVPLAFFFREEIRFTHSVQRWWCISHDPRTAVFAGAPWSRSAITGLGAGVGVGMGYTDCKHEFDAIAKAGEKK